MPRTYNFLQRRILDTVDELPTHEVKLRNLLNETLGELEANRNYIAQLESRLMESDAMLRRQHDEKF